MDKERKKKYKIFLYKFLAVLVILGLGIGVGITEVGWENINEKGLIAIVESSEEYLKNMQDYLYYENYENQQTTGSGDFEIFVFNVGQADSILIRSEDEYMLIDAGNNADGTLIVDELKKMGVTKLEYLIATHSHEDHIGGMDDVINNIEVDNFFIPDVQYNTTSYIDIIKACNNNKLKMLEPPIGYIFKLGKASCEVMLVGSNTENLNLTSIVIETTKGNNNFLFMGDAEIENEELRAWNDIDILKVAHHGSSTSTSKDFIEQTKPEIALISVGENNDYGHPHKEIRDLLEEKNIKTYRTDLNGTIYITSNGETYNVESLDINLNGNEK